MLPVHESMLFFSTVSETNLLLVAKVFRDSDLSVLKLFSSSLDLTWYVMADCALCPRQPKAECLLAKNPAALG